jgi:hypothetical protein
MKSSVAIGYVTVQFFAAVLACACVVSQLPESMQDKIIEAGAAPGLPSPIDEHSSTYVMLNSTMGSMLLCFLYMTVYFNRDFDMELAPACFAMGYAALTIIGVGMTGGNFNPVSMLPGLFYPDFRWCCALARGWEAPWGVCCMGISWLRKTPKSSLPKMRTNRLATGNIFDYYYDFLKFFVTSCFKYKFFSVQIKVILNLTNKHL